MNLANRVLTALAAAALLIVGAPAAARASDCVVSTVKGQTTVTMPSPVAGQDNTPALNACVDQAPDGARIVFPTGKVGTLTYQVEGRIDISGRTNLTLNAAGTTFRASSLVGLVPPTPEEPKGYWRSHVFIKGSSNIDINDLTIESAGTCQYSSSFEGEAGVNVNGAASNISLNRLTVRGTGGDAVSVGPGQGIRDVTVSGLSGDCLGRMAMSVSGGATNVTLQDSTFSQIGRSFFDIEPIPGRHVENVDVLRNTIGDHRLNTLSCGGWGTNGDVTFQGNASSIPLIMKCLSFGPLLVDDNTGTGAAVKPWGLKSMQAFMGQPNTMTAAVSGNVQHFSANAAFLAALETDACTLAVTGNDFTGADAVSSGEPPPGCTWTEEGNTL
jgi:hypothetical protein